MPIPTLLFALLFWFAPPSEAVPPPAVGLNLEVHSRRIRTSKPLFVRLTLTNRAAMGSMVVSDWKFRGGDKLHADWLEAAEGLGLDYLELIGPDGKPVQADRYDGLVKTSIGPSEIAVKPADVETSSRADALAKQGYSPEEITRKLNEWRHRAAEDARESHYPAKDVPAGASIRTVSFCVLKSGCPGKGFAQLPFDLSRPGRYRIRAVRDYRPIKTTAGGPWDIYASSPWVQFEVIR